MVTVNLKTLLWKLLLLLKYFFELVKTIFSFEMISKVSDFKSFLNKVFKLRVMRVFENSVLFLFLVFRFEF